MPYEIRKNFILSHSLLSIGLMFLSDNNIGIFLLILLSIAKRKKAFWWVLGPS